MNVIGIDFDNTIVSYDSLFYTLAKRKGFIDSNSSLNKKEVRDKIRSIEEGDVKWQMLQGEVYGPLMLEASPMSGSIDALKELGKVYDLFIVSHKTEYANYDPTRTPLRAKALEWMRSVGLIGITNAPVRGVYFESTREQKVHRILKLNCNVFVDDLEEVFEHPAWPANTEKILFRPDGRSHLKETVRVCRNWKEIMKLICDMHDQ